MKEAWKIIDKTHEISSEGRVRNIKTNHILAAWSHTTGYPMVRLSFKGKGMRIHRLVAEAFISNPEKKKTVNHKNGIKTDNHVSNLEWASQSENNIHARKIGLNKNVGENHNFAKLTYKQVVRIRAMYKPGKTRYSKATMSQAKIAKKFGVTQTVISDIIRNKSWRSS